MEKIKILLVDDHAIMRDGIKALLSIYDDIEVIGEASAGREAMEMARELNPDVVVMDISMPGMDGLEVTHRLTKRNPRMKVIILTQHDNREYILSTIKVGAAGYIPKKALGSDLVSAIRAIRSGDSFLYPSAARTLIDDYRKQAEQPDIYESLTEREREILKLIAEGRTSREIAEALYISQKTVQGHRTKIMEKLDLHNRTELIKYAMRKGLVDIG